MTNKQTYWLADANGNKALVEGAAERDRWLPVGWTESTEPSGDEKVWCRIDGVQNPALFPAAAIPELWGPKGWAPSAPPEPISPVTGESALAAPAPVPTTSAVEAAEQPSTKTAAAASGDKEKNRG